MLIEKNKHVGCRLNFISIPTKVSKRYKELDTNKVYGNMASSVDFSWKKLRSIQRCA
jgi:hypothetical protein